MKQIKFLAFALVSMLTFASCQDGGYGDMTDVTPNTAYGNDTITEHNVWTIAQLRASNKYKTVLGQYRDYKLVDDDIQLKVRVTGNDMGGNIYNKVAVQDEEGNALFVCVYSGGMFSYLPVGQELLINLKGLYIGTYGYQQQIGTPYTTSSGNTYPGRMDPKLWQQHFKLLGYDPSAPNCQPLEVKKEDLDMTKRPELVGRLLTIKGVTLTDANGTNTWAPENGSDFSISRYISGFPSSVVIYTSTSAKFAAEVIPSGKVDITGVFSRYSSTWQIQLRTNDDVRVAE